MPAEPVSQPRTIAVEITDDLVAEVRATLAAEIVRRQRAATRAAAELDAEDAKDKRPGALAIFKTLAGTARLAQFADALAAGWVTAGGNLPADLADAIPDRPPISAMSRPAELALIDAEVAALNNDGTAAAADPPAASTIAPDGADPSPDDIAIALAVIGADPDAEAVE